MKTTLLLTCLFALLVFAGGDALMAGCGACGSGGGSGCTMTGSSKSDCGAGGCSMKAQPKAMMKGQMHEGHHDPMEPTVSTAGLKVLLDSKTRMVLLDARSGKYDDGHRIPGARSLDAGADAKRIQRTLRSKKGLVVTYCSNLKCPASASLAKRLRTLGYRNVIEYPYGIQGWREAGYNTSMARR